MPLRDLIRMFRGPRADADAVHSAYAQIVGQAREPALYTRLAVPDTPEGRLEAVMLHVFLVLRRLKAATGGPQAAESETARHFAQALFDLMFQDLDRNLREMGVGDTVLGKRVKRMAKGFYGRIALYEKGLAADDDATLAAALAETVYDTAEGGETPPAAGPSALAAYVRRQAADLEDQPEAGILAGRVRFLSAADTAPTEAGERS